MADPVDLANEILAELDAGRPDSRIVTLAREVLRLHAEQAAGRDHVERVVREECERAASAAEEIDDHRPHDSHYSGRIARRVADRLSAPVLSAEDVTTLKEIRRGPSTNLWLAEANDKPDRIAIHQRHIALLDRLIAGAKP